MLTKKQKKNLYLIIPLFSLIILFTYFIMSGTEQVASKNYKNINIKSQLLSQENNRIDFVFWSDCGACFSLTKALNEWLASKKHVELQKIPAAGSGWDTDAKLYYTMEELGGVRTRGLYNSYIDAIHVQKTLRSFTSKKEFIKNYLKVNEEQFMDTFNGREVSEKLTRSREIVQRLGIRSVPQLIVNGKYFLNMQSFNSYDEIFAEVERLIREKP